MFGESHVSTACYFPVTTSYFPGTACYSRGSAMYSPIAAMDFRGTAMEFPIAEVDYPRGEGRSRWGVVGPHPGPLPILGEGEGSREDRGVWLVL